MLGSVGVFAVAVPTFDSFGQFDGFASKVASTHAFCSVVSRDGSCLGSVVTTEPMFACPEGCVMFTLRLAPFAREVLLLEVALKSGLKASDEQFSTWNGEDTSADEPSVELRSV